MSRKTELETSNNMRESLSHICFMWFEDIKSDTTSFKHLVDRHAFSQNIHTVTVLKTQKQRHTHRHCLFLGRLKWEKHTLN